MGYAKSNESCRYMAKGGKYLLKELLDLEISRLVILRAIVARLKKMEESAGEIEEALEPKLEEVPPIEKQNWAWNVIAESSETLQKEGIDVELSFGLYWMWSLDVLGTMFSCRFGCTDVIAVMNAQSCSPQPELTNCTL